MAMAAGLLYSICGSTVTFNLIRSSLACFVFFLREADFNPSSNKADPLSNIKFPNIPVNTLSWLSALL